MKMSTSNNQGNKIENFVIFKRDLTNDFRERKISRDEFTMYCWLRLNANAYGKAITSLDDLKNDLFHRRQEKNYINKMLLSLKRQRYLYYKKRAGSRGSFSVYFGDFIDPKHKQIITLDRYFSFEEVRGKDEYNILNNSNLTQSFDDESQNSKDLLDDINSLQNAFSLDSKVRTLNNDKNKDKDIDKNRSKFVYFKNPIFVETFKPKSKEEIEALEIAKEVGEIKMNFILSILERYGIEVIKKAFADFKEEVNGKIDDWPAFFNSKVQLVLSSLHTDKQLNNSQWDFESQSI